MEKKSNERSVERPDVCLGVSTKIMKIICIKSIQLRFNGYHIHLVTLDKIKDVTICNQMRKTRCKNKRSQKIREDSFLVDSLRSIVCIKVLTWYIIKDTFK